METNRKRKAETVDPQTSKIGRAAGTKFRHAFNGISDLGSLGHFSRVWHCGDLPWRLYIRTENSDRTDNVKYFSAYLYCNEESVEEWSAECTFTLTLVNQKYDANIIRKHTSFAVKPFGLGIMKFLPWEKWMTDPEKGFVKNDTIIMEAIVEVHKTTGVRTMIPVDFSTSNAFGDDGVVLKIEGKDVHVSKNILAAHSPFFATMFFGDFSESGEAEIELKDLAHDDFVELMYVIYPSARDINVSSYKPVLETADRFQMKYAIDEVEAYLKRTKKVTRDQKLLMADKYRLGMLKSHCLASFTTHKEIKALAEKPEFEDYTDSTKIAILKRMLSLVAD